MAAYDLSELSILIVDDNDYMLELVETMLAALKVTKVTRCTSGREAMIFMKNFQPDIVVTDWQMAPMSGIDLFHEIRDGKDICCPQVPVIMLTAFSEIEKVVEARDAGITSFLKKPISARSLYQRIVEIIERVNAEANQKEQAAKGPAEGDWVIG